MIFTNSTVTRDNVTFPLNANKCYHIDISKHHTCPFPLYVTTHPSIFCVSGPYGSGKISAGLISVEIIEK